MLMLGDGLTLRVGQLAVQYGLALGYDGREEGFNRVAKMKMEAKLRSRCMVV